MKPYLIYFAVVGTIAVAALGMTNRESERLFARVDIISATLRDDKVQVKCL